MNDLFQSTVGRDEFQQWLGLGTAPFTIWHGEKAVVTLSRLEKNPSVDYLYRIGVGQDNSISWNSSMQFCGVYDRDHRALYLTKDSLRILMDGTFPLVTEAGPSMAEEISSRVNERVENTIANDRNNLPIREVTDWQASRDLEYYREHGVKESAVRQLFSSQEPDGQFHSDYKLDNLPETAFIAYITDPELFVQTEADQYIKNNQEKFLLQFLENDALMAAYQALMQDTGNPVHRMKAITDAVKGCGAKTVTVTVQKDGQELTFKAAADSLTGHRTYYSSTMIPASDRQEFERLFGRYASYNAEDITKITYICKTCSRLSAAEKAEAMTINRLMDFPMGRLSASDKKWLENRVHDRRPEVASLAREVYGMHFPYAERNERKNRLLINTLVFELDNVTVYDEFGDEYAIHVRFTADRLANVLTMINMDDGGTEQTVTLEKKQMAKLLRWTVHTLEIFMWPEDYDLSPDDPFLSGPYLDLLPEFWPEDWDDEDDDADGNPDGDAPEAEVYWRVQIEYADETSQEIVSYQDYLFDKPAELLFALSEYFEPDTEDFDGDFEEE